MDKFWENLPTNTRNCLKRSKIEEPWNWSVKGLLRVPGIGPKGIMDIAKATEKLCV